ncbi:undecaprenyl-phosphate glucose phosphotransferase [Bradyrhizobium sp. CSA112]|uniref:undecaprenyl-phosphate glucose phosphotransferase n=1 Tax=Bradyrhizobium sp. CSA112 TaxID=2699170 RepID=UPI0023B1A67C|nr:undecaprenyl-phosphate glucose phosphotransferase [Bradyrhizobium sp. CSA112]MDE5452784.1 undecaprenyl-phosphate glucose phosphotransferase [Bradyrhizobium sp. CSA112]
MNFINRHIAASLHEGIALEEYSSPLAAQRKWPVRYGSIELVAICADLATIVLASIISVFLCRLYSSGAAAGLANAIGSAIVVSAMFVSLLKMRGMYRPSELLVLRNQIRAVCGAWLYAFILLAAMAGLLNFGDDFSRGAGIAFALTSLALLFVGRTLMKSLLMRGLSGRKFAGGNIILISDQPQSSDVGLLPTLSMLGFCVTQHFRLPSPRFGSDHRKRLSARVIENARGSNVEEIIVEADPNQWSELRAFVAELRVLPTPVSFVPVGALSEMFRRPTRDLGSTVCVEIQRGPLTFLERAIKRFTDLVGAGLALVILSPLLAVVALAIKLDSSGPVLFRQQRCGFNGRSFSIYKFRTMRVLEDGPSVIQARPVDSRVTRVGKWLRRTSIDELPQLINVLYGSMSLVGPRPHAISQDGQFDKVVRNYAFRRRVKPGLTGWAQIHGCRGPTPTAASIEGRVEYDLWYIDNWSVRLDLAILVQTPIEVLRGRNAY